MIKLALYLVISSISTFAAETLAAWALHTDAILPLYCAGVLGSLFGSVCALVALRELSHG
jgi:hypothetical protein